MGNRLTPTHGHLGVRPLLLAALMVVTLVVTLGATSASAAKAATCSVKNTDTGRTFPRLQQAVDAAKPGAHLIVKGTCVGGTFIDKDLAIAGVKTRRTGKPVLDGGVESYAMEGSTRVLTIKPKVNVSIRDLIIRNGRATRIPNGGGISNKGRLTLRDVVVRDNRAVRGGGIYNDGALRMLGRSVVKNNTDLYVAGASPASAVFNVGRLILDDRTRIRNNLGWTPVVNEGTLRMKGATDISRNFPMRGPSGGIQNRGTLVMNDASSITEQGGVTNSGSLTMNDKSSIHHNIQSGCVSVMCGTGAPGAGVRNSGTLTMNDTSSIHHNWVGGPVWPEQTMPARGGGVHNTGTVVMTGSSRIHDNEARNGTNGVAGLGGGIYSASGGTLDGVYCAPHTYANVYANTPDDCYIEP